MHREKNDTSVRLYEICSPVGGELRITLTVLEYVNFL